MKLFKRSKYEDDFNPYEKATLRAMETLIKTYIIGISLVILMVIILLCCYE